MMQVKQYNVESMEGFVQYENNNKIKVRTAPGHMEVQEVK
jgi:hypothetical protein